MFLWCKILNLIVKINTKIYRGYFRKRFASGGDTVIFYGRNLPVIRGEKNNILGSNVKINEFAYLYARKSAIIVVGDNSTISSYAKLITSSYDSDKWIADLDENEDIHIDQDIIIGSKCWIANGVTILPGVTISGSNVIIAAGSVVT